MSTKEKYNIYESTYKSSFFPKIRTDNKKYYIHPQYANPIIQDCKQYLVTTFTEGPLEENPNCFREKLLKKVDKKISEKYLEKPLDESIYYLEYLKKWKTQTAMDFAISSPHEDMTSVELLRCLFRLPDNNKISLSTSSSHYKNPTVYAPLAYHNKVIPLKTNPTVDLTIPNLYRKMEASEYTDKICKEAEYFLNHQLRTQRKMEELHHI